MAAEEVFWDLWKQGQFNLFGHEQESSILIYNNLKIFSQNVCKNMLIVNTILKTHFHFNIIFIQDVKIEEDGLDLFSVLFIFYFLFDLFFYFLFLEWLGLGLISHAINHLMV